MFDKLFFKHFIYSKRFNLMQLRTAVAKTYSYSNTAFTHYLLLTNVSLSMALSGLGDVVQQKYQITKGRQHQINTFRVVTMTTTGLTVGMLCHYWYQVLDRMLPGRSIKTVLKKLAVDQLIFSPICLCAFFVTLALSKKSLNSVKCRATQQHQTNSIKSTVGNRTLPIDEKICQDSKQDTPFSEVDIFIEDLWHKGIVLYLSEWVVWPPAQLINFYFLPTKYRVLYDNIVSLAYDTFTSFICNDVHVDDIKELAASSEKLLVFDAEERVLALTDVSVAESHANGKCNLFSCHEDYIINDVLVDR